LERGEALTRRLHAEHGEALYRWALGRLSDPRDAEELVAETLVRAWRRYDQYDPERGSERSWLFAIARNAATDLYRRSRRRLRVVRDDEIPELAVDDEAESIAEISLVRDALDGLSPNHRAVIVEAFFEGMTVSEIARQLGIPEGTVKSRIYYGMKALRATLEEEGVLA
jgi:RNA polymerase sigma-70 factor (ECF subfamily)